eukprot:Gregarina_sp_Pseudo_9__2134@NODE_248_length_3438_cov_12_274787_g231_i0_p1_GENE_NODE_248_length_3438_cov_12_274787_g231_i0NODE_248_length_3438_cov_12_274787_g231_i0_p1_ORF_typecomplete_len1034_score330_48ABC2_membrane/PF01061_24/0_0015ABC2_membrane/PF01061_24/2e36ABC_tran/PF00005_27/6_3e25ABC2_membrane_3/PF12698_7/4_5e02ABC2_membrane_3/PF12698_7/8_6e12AAA_21/PF13304_6/0_24AAA_21/PF13304_6/0_0011AAA_15/PF13175_6/0_00097AAA_15/PF13175_6/2AAA_16/PF13191_6/4_3e05AAA_16/PF13191_6/1_8e03AAA_29/PF13555_
MGKERLSSMSGSETEAVVPETAEAMSETAAVSQSGSFVAATREPSGRARSESSYGNLEAQSEEETPRPSLVAGSMSPGAAMWCEDLSYTVKKKTILHEINFCANPGELTVIMGPSGSGKTSLLNALLQRLKKGKVTGSKGVNGQPSTPAVVRDHCHYVMSYDIALSYLTVRETLETTARLRMPGVPRSEQAAAVDWVLEALELTECQHVLVGGEWRKGISKGQLKRVAIAQELLGDPDLVFLDEPTTGLDSNLAYELVSILKNIAREKNKTIVASIHQPSQKAFELFDRVVLISNGHLIYHGPGSEAVGFLSSTGRKIPRSFSPPDFLLEVATDENYTGCRSFHLPSQKSSSLSGITDLQLGAAGDEDSKTVDSWRMERPNYSTADQLQELERTFKKSAYYATLRDDIAAAKSKALAPKHYNAAAKWSEEFRVLWKRSTLNSLRNPLTSTIIVLVNILQALVLGALFFQLQDEKADVTTPALSDWSLWDNPILQYLAYGLDREGYDPFIDLMAQGVDGEGRQVLLDFAVNPEIVNYLFEAVQCTYELGNVSAANYPPHRWPAGSIAGDPETTETPETGTTTAVPSVSPGADTVTPAFPSRPFEDVVSLLVEATQLIDYAIKRYDAADVECSWSDPAADSFTKWINVASCAKPVVYPLTCCLGMYRPFEALPSKDCAATFPNYNFQKMPNLPDFSTLQEATASGRRLLEDFYRFLVERGPTGKEQPAATRALTAQRPHSANRRRLGSSLGGLASDLWELIAENPNSPLSTLINSMRNMFGQIRECETQTCDYFSSVIDGASKVTEDITATALSVLNMGGAIFFCVANLGFASYDCLLAFPKDRAVFNRENANGMYRGSSFFLGRTLADIPFQFVPCLLWSTIYYWMVGYEATARQFFAYLVMCFLVSFCAYSFGYFISAYSPRLEVAVVIAPLVLVVMLVLAGFFLRDPQIPRWINWFKFLSIYRWGFFGMAAIQFPPNKGFGALDNNLILVILGITETRWGISALMLIALSLGFRILSYIGLVFCNRTQGLES